MGSVCSSNSNKKSRKKKGKPHHESQTSSSDIEVEVVKVESSRQNELNFRPEDAEKTTAPLADREYDTVEATPPIASPMNFRPEDTEKNTAPLADREYDTVEATPPIASPINFRPDDTQKNTAEFFTESEMLTGSKFTVMAPSEDISRRLIVPPHLASLPEEMQNLLMGRWPVPPATDSRVLRLFVAAEESESQVERIWLTKEVYPKLRNYTEDLGFHLHVMDIHALQPTSCVPHRHLMDLTRRAMKDNINIWLVILNNKLGWNLPTAIETADFEDIGKRLEERKPGLSSRLSLSYCLDENNLPPVYRLLPQPAEVSSAELQELYDEMCYAVTEEQDELYMNEGFHEEVNTALANHVGMSNNILVVRRRIYNLPTDRSDPTSKHFTDVDFEGNLHARLGLKHSHLVNRVELIVSNDFILKWNPPLSDIESALRGEETSYVRSMCAKTEEKLKATISRMVQRQTTVDPYLAAGLPPALCQELLMHAHKQQLVLTNSVDPSPVVEQVLDQLRENPSSPLLLYGIRGCGLQTWASQLARQEATSDVARMVALRYLTLTPESQTIMSVLFTVLEQVSVGFGGTMPFKNLNSLSYGEIISSIAKCTTNLSVTIILCGLYWDMVLEGQDLSWISQTLPRNVQCILLTSCPILPTKVKCMQLPMTEPQEMEQFFLNTLKAENRCITAEQHSEVTSVLRQAPLPALASLLASLALDWTSQTEIKESCLPKTMNQAMIQLMEQAEKVVGRECTSRILAYISTAKFGLSDSELEDVLAIDDSLMSSLYPTHCPMVRRCPLSIWLYLKHKFASVMNVAYVYGHRVYQLQRLVTGMIVLDKYGLNTVPFHSVLAEYFEGTWAEKLKLLTDSHKPDIHKTDRPIHKKSETKIAVTCSVILQPKKYGRHTNCRKFLCLLHHLLFSQPKASRCAVAKHHLLDLQWLMAKLDATSLIQLLDDLQMAIATATSLTAELCWLQLLVAKHAAQLNVSGHQLHSFIHGYFLKDQQPKAELVTSDVTRRISVRVAVPKLKLAVTESTDPFLVRDDSPPEPLPSNPDQEGATGPPECENYSLACLSGFFSNDKSGKQVVSISKTGGEIVVWDTVSNKALQRLQNIDTPSDLVFLDDRRAVVLCNRELKAFDLQSGMLVSNIRGMLNIKMPYFHVRDADTVIVLARNRMSVNVLDVMTGQIHATFKAGEDRFLNSLMVSGNGNMLVCGDETQKPFPLLVWELGQSKLLHDLRMPQHEFLTNIAAITHDGEYVACACRGLYDAASNNFVVVYDLTSGQLYRQFRLGASVTAMAVASDSLMTVMTLNDGSMAVYDIHSGNCKCHMTGVKAIYNKVQLSTDETVAVSYSVDAGPLPIACTVALWNINEGHFLASYTFDSAVTCCQHIAHNNTILVGLALQCCYVKLTLFNAKPKLRHHSGLKV